jgi:Mg2+ and Co2+ transporter CorA
MNEAIENEIYELEELIASFTAHNEDGRNTDNISQLRESVMRLKQMLFTGHCEELYNDSRPLSVGGEVSS